MNENDTTQDSSTLGGQPRTAAPRVAPNDPQPDGITAVEKDAGKEKGEERNADIVRGRSGRWSASRPVACTAWYYRKHF
jgi:hypothetical protein